MLALGSGWYIDKGAPDIYTVKAAAVKQVPAILRGDALTSIVGHAGNDRDLVTHGNQVHGQVGDQGCSTRQVGVKTHMQEKNLHREVTFPLLLLRDCRQHGVSRARRWP